MFNLEKIRLGKAQDVIVVFKYLKDYHRKKGFNKFLLIQRKGLITMGRNCKEPKRI